MASLYRTSCESPWNSALIAAHPPSCSSNLAIKSRTRLEHLEWSAIKRLRTKVINCDWKEACKTRGAAPLKAAGLLGAASARQTVAGVFWIVSFFFFFFPPPTPPPPALLLVLWRSGRPCYFLPPEGAPPINVNAVSWFFQIKDRLRGSLLQVSTYDNYVGFFCICFCSMEALNSVENVIMQ